MAKISNNPVTLPITGRQQYDVVEQGIVDYFHSKGFERKNGNMLDGKAYLIFREIEEDKACPPVRTIQIIDAFDEHEKTIARLFANQPFCSLQVERDCEHLPALRAIVHKARQKYPAKRMEFSPGPFGEEVATHASFNERASAEHEMGLLRAKMARAYEAVAEVRKNLHTIGWEKTAVLLNGYDEHTLRIAQHLIKKEAQPASRKEEQREELEVDFLTAHIKERFPLTAKQRRKLDHQEVDRAANGNYLSDYSLDRFEAELEKLKQAHAANPAQQTKQQIAYLEGYINDRGALEQVVDDKVIDKYLHRLKPGNGHKTSR